MKEVNLEIVSNERINDSIFLLKLKGDLSAIKNPGEFVSVKLPNYYLRRPFSVFDYCNDSLSLLYKVLGKGTSDMTDYQPGQRLNVLVNLGNGFTDLEAKKPLLIGGGIGIAPLHRLAKDFLLRGIKPTIILGFKNQEEAIMMQEFSKYGRVILLTDDGSAGLKGNAVTYLANNKEDFDCYYACGPMIMLKNLALLPNKGYLSLEARMGCGFGACMGCSIETKNGPKRVCKEGPVFSSDEVIFS